VAALFLFPSSPKFLTKVSTLMIQKMTRHPVLLPHMIIRTNYSTTATSTTPPGTSTPLTLTPNPNATIRILQPNPADPPRDPPYRPWTNTDDQELISLKRDGES
jgi:hypothetical protein